MAASNVEKKVAQLRNEWLGVIRALGIERASAAADEERLARFENAVGNVFLFCAQLELAEELGHGDEWRAANDCRVDYGSGDDE